MSVNGDEDDELLAAQQDATHWRNAFWARVRSEQIAEDREGRGFGGNYRAVPNPQGGAQSVRPQDTSGSYDYCWCGLPADHTWPGKDKGRRHPKNPPVNTKEAMTAVPEAPHIDRKMLRTYHEDLIDVIVRAVNDYGVRYRLKNNGCMLYPPDGAAPFTVYARNTDRQAKTARKWFIDHVLAADEKIAFVSDPERLLEDMDVREKARQLQEQLNGPEHETKETSDERRARKARERTEAAEKMAEAAAARTERALTPPPRPKGEWRPFVNGLGQENPNFEINENGVIRCKVCGWATENAKALGGHFMTNHSEEHQKKLWGRQSRDRATATKQKNAVNTGVEEAIRILSGVIGRDPNVDTAALNQRIKDLTKQVDDMTTALFSAQQERDEAQKRADEAQARLDLLREALGA